MLPLAFEPRQTDAQMQPLTVHARSRGSAERVLRQVSGWLLPGAEDIDPPSDGAQERLLVDLAKSERLLGPLLVAVDAGALPLSSEAMDLAVAGHEDSMRWCIHLELRLLEVVDWFDSIGGVEFLVVKGPAVAHLDEVEPSLRSFADIDLLVKGADLDRALGALVEHGAVRRVPQRRPGYDRRFIKSVGLVCADEVELDIHRTYCVGAHGLRIPLDDLFAHPDHFALAGRQLAAPIRTHRALHAAYHAVIGTPAPALRTLRDLAEYLVRPDLTPAVLAREAKRWRGTAVLAEAVRLMFETLIFDAPEWKAWLEQHPASDEELSIIASTQSGTPWPVEWSTIRELRWADRVPFLWAVAVPSAEDLHARGLTHSQRLIQGARHVAPELRSRLTRR
jgi:hypothetical protein